VPLYHSYHSSLWGSLDENSIAVEGAKRGEEEKQRAEGVNGMK
jgi:hypothetical protein